MTTTATEAAAKTKRTGAMKAALEELGHHLDEPFAPALELLCELGAFELAIARHAGVKPMPTAEAIAQDKCHQFDIEYKTQLAAMIEVLATRKSAPAHQFIEAIRPIVKPKVKKRRPLRTVAQVTRRLQDLANDLANGDTNAPAVRAEVYALQTLLVLIKSQEPKQMLIPQLHASAEQTDDAAAPGSSATTKAELKAALRELAAESADDQLTFPQEPHPE